MRKPTDRILITGSRGQLGFELRELLPDAISTTRNELDITDETAVINFIKSNNVDIIINCAAYTQVDEAEDHVELAKLTNINGPLNLAKSGAKLVHISTDYVFDGTGHTPYLPTSEPNPISIYGKTKLAGEQAILNNNDTAIIIRTAWLYSTYGNNFVKTMLRLGKGREQINVVCDQIGTPTYAADLAKAIVMILPQINKTNKGIYHYTNEGVCSWFDFATEIMRLSDLKCKVNPISTAEYPTKAKRPVYSVLDKSTIKKTFGIQIPYWKESLSLCLNILNELDNKIAQN